MLPCDARCSLCEDVFGSANLGQGFNWKAHTSVGLRGGVAAGGTWIRKCCSGRKVVETRGFMQPSLPHTPTTSSGDLPAPEAAQPQRLSNSRLTGNPWSEIYTPEPIDRTERARGRNRLLQSSAAPHLRTANIDRGVQWLKPEALWLAQDQRYGSVCKKEGPVVPARAMFSGRLSRRLAVDQRLSHAKASGDKAHDAVSGGWHVKATAPSFKARDRVANPSASQVWVGRLHWCAVACSHHEVRGRECRILGASSMKIISATLARRGWRLASTVRNGSSERQSEK